VSESIEQVLRQLITKELERTRSEDPLVRAVQELTEQVSSLVSALGGSPPTRDILARSTRGHGPANAEADALQEHYRPDEVRLLFVTSRTPIATPDASFYLANSHLFRCVRAAFVEAFGPSVPNGEAFLEYFRDSNCWLVILPDELRRGRGRPPRRLLPDTSYLVDIIESTSPEHVVAARRAVARPLVEAVEAAGLTKDRLLMVRTPRELWKPQFVAKLKKLLASERVPVTKQ
jgi:hypothetical protein